MRPDNINLMGGEIVAETIFAILSDAKAREEAQITAKLSEEFNAGLAWFSKEQ